MKDSSPRQTVQEMHEYADAAAMEILAAMDDEEVILMVRDFCQVMADWQPNIKIYADEPVMLGLSCLSAAQLFRLGFSRAYGYTSKKVEAMEAIDKAFGGNE